MTVDAASIQAHICVKGGTEAISFYEKAFGATCPFHQLSEDGKRILHARLHMFGGEVMLHDEFPEFGGDVLSPLTRGGASCAVAINLKQPSDVDAAFERATAAGAKAIMEPSDAFWGSRYARISDPFGHVWEFNAPLATS